MIRILIWPTAQRNQTGNQKSNSTKKNLVNIKQNNTITITNISGVSRL